MTLKPCRFPGCTYQHQEKGDFCLLHPDGPVPPHAAPSVAAPPPAVLSPAGPRAAGGAASFQMSGTVSEEGEVLVEPANFQRPRAFRGDSE